MRNFILRRRALPKIGDLVEWINNSTKSATGRLIVDYGRGPFRVLNIRYDAQEDNFRFQIANNGIPIIEWVSSQAIRKYEWGIGNIS